MLCNLLVILKIENVPGAKYIGSEMPGVKCRRGKVTRGCTGRNDGDEMLGVKYP